MVAKGYSTDLRDRVVALVEAGESRREAARLLDLAASTTIRWMDRWLKGADNGIDHEPMLTAWMQTSEAPRPSYDIRQGAFVAEDVWPSPGITPTTWRLGEQTLGLKRHSLVNELLSGAPGRGEAGAGERSDRAAEPLRDLCRGRRR